MQSEAQQIKSAFQDRPTQSAPDNGLLKPVLYAIAIFITLGIAIANETLAQLGLEGNYIAVFSLAFILAAVLLGRNLFFLGLVVIGVGVLNLPDATVSAYGVDRDILLAIVCAIVLLPTVYELIVK